MLKLHRTANIYDSFVLFDYIGSGVNVNFQLWCRSIFQREYVILNVICATKLMIFMETSSQLTKCFVQIKSICMDFQQTCNVTEAAKWWIHRVL